jgi:hypothetical protein
VHGTAANDVWITGSSGTILHWNGSAFEHPASPVAHTLGGVWAASASDAWITSYGGQLLRWNGTAWSLVTAPGSGELRGITGRAADDIWAVGYLGRMLHWNGTVWTAATGPNAANALEAVTATTGGFLAMGFHGAAWRMTGGQVESTSETVIGAGAISDVYVVSETEAFAVSGGILLRFDGTDWKASLLSKTINGIAGTSASDVWGVGTGGAILHFDGATWSAVASPTTKHLVSVLALAADDAWAVGSQVILHWNGTSWSEVASPVVAAFVDLWAASPTDIWAVGTGGAIVRWNGTAWTQVANTLAVSFQTVWGSGPNNVWIVGNSQAVLWNGSMLTPAPAPIAANQLWGKNASNIYAATSFHGGIAHYNGSVWTEHATANTQQLFAIGGAGDRIWAVGAGGAILMR